MCPVNIWCLCPLILQVALQGVPILTVKTRKQTRLAGRLSPGLHPECWGGASNLGVLGPQTWGVFDRLEVLKLSTHQNCLRLFVRFVYFLSSKDYGKLENIRKCRLIFVLTVTPAKGARHFVRN